MVELSIWDQRTAHKREVRRSRRGWPPKAVRPLCIGCDKVLAPDWKHNFENDITSPLSSETDELRGWEGRGNVFHSNECAVRWALRQPFVRAARLNNEALAERLRNQRDETRARKGASDATS